MKKNKEIIYNLKSEDLDIIKKFIELYDDVKEKFEEYTRLCESIRKNIIFQQQSRLTQNSSIEQIFEKIKIDISEQINSEENVYIKQMLNKQCENLEKEVKALEKYKIIEQIYNKIYYGNLSKYFTNNPIKGEKDIEEEPTKEYSKSQNQPRKDYYFNEKSTITHIYIIVKYLYDFYETYYVNEKEIHIDFELLKNNLEFYRIFKQAIIKYIDENYELIKQSINKIDEDIEKEIKIKANSTIRKIK